jgi:phage tail-like protein
MGLPNDFYPPVSFQFSVSVNGQSGADSSFQSVSGIESTITTEDIVEGGENRFVHKLPNGIKQNNIELKRGISPAKSELMKWCKAVMEQGLSQRIKPRSLVVHLLDEKQNPIRSWSFENAFPVSWKVESFDATKNEVAIETITLSYTYSKRNL